MVPFCNPAFHTPLSLGATTTFTPRHTLRSGLCGRAPCGGAAAHSQSRRAGGPTFLKMSEASGAGEQQGTAGAARGTVFVAGATGNVGSRLVRLLVGEGYRVCAASRNVATVVDSLGVGDEDGAGLVQPVGLDVAKASEAEMGDAIGDDASVVVSALGAPFSFGAVDGFGLARLMRAAAKRENVRQLIVVSSIGVGRPWAFPAAALNLFGGVLLFKDFSEAVTRKAARDYGKSYLIVRPGGMESPTDEFGLTHNVVLRGRNSLAGGLVSNMQIAELIVSAIEHPDAAANKTVEAVAETSAPKRALEELLAGMAAES